MKKSHILFSCALPVLAGGSLVHGADITWTTDVTEITSVNDIDLTGTLAHAGSWGGVSSSVTAGAENDHF